MRKILLLALALTAAAVASLAPAPKAEAATCSWACGPCGMFCPCETCIGAKPMCPCLVD